MKKRNNDGGGRRFLHVISVVALFLFVNLIAVLYTPIDYVRYLFSHHRKDMKKLYGKDARYTWLATTDNEFKIYELISKNHLPVQYYRYPIGKDYMRGYFLYKDVLLIVNEVPHFNCEKGEWYTDQVNDWTDVQTCMQTNIDQCNRSLNAPIGEPLCKQAVLLVPENALFKGEKKHIHETDGILPYGKKNPAQQIRSYLETL